MPRAREYKNAAERQAAYRARHRDRELPLQGYLAALARTLHSVMGEATRAGNSPLPPELNARRTDDTLRNLIRYLRRRCETAAETPALADEKGGAGGTDRG